jgi:hypothetical protein
VRTPVRQRRHEAKQIVALQFLTNTGEHARDIRDSSRCEMASTSLFG